ncbi:MAG: NUDIX hydrolase [Candidatus Dormibacterales bacterium]
MTQPVPALPNHHPVEGPSLRGRLRRNLGAFRPRDAEDLTLVQAAVVVLILAGPGEPPWFPICLRPRRLRSHAGQLALPGGRVEAGEDHTAAALRELEEELSVRARPEEVLGRLDDFPTRSGFAVRPLVVWGGKAGELVPSPDEVDRVFPVPVSVLERTGGVRFLPEVGGGAPTVQIRLDFAVVHAPTAAILFQFREVALHGREARVAHFAQPPFTWR